MVPDAVPEWDMLKSQVIKLGASLGLTFVEHSPEGSKDIMEHRTVYETSVSRAIEHPYTDRAKLALAWLHARDARDRVFGAALFIDPAWNMLLDLYINHCRNQQISISSLCLASQVPATSALRWISLLEQRGILMRTPDINDRRRAFVTFTPDGLRKIENALDLAAESDRKLGIGRISIS